MSGLGVKLFLPALIVVNLGHHLHLDTALNYIPILGGCRFIQRRTTLTMSLRLSSMVYHLYFCIHWPGPLGVSIIQAAPMGDPSMCIQQYDIPPLAAPTISRQRGIPSTHPSRSRRDVIGN
jgi:hypothetical protein